MTVKTPANRILLDGPYMRFPTITGKDAAIKRIGARLDKKSNEWKLPATSLNALQLYELVGKEPFQYAPDEVYDLIYELWGFPSMSQAEAENAKVHPKWNNLYEFQKRTVEYLYCNPHEAGLVGLSPGLGKTAISIITADLLHLNRILVLSPLTLAPAWEGEICKWSEHTPSIHRATAQDRQPGDHGWTVTNHEVIQEIVLRDEQGTIRPASVVGGPKEIKKWIMAGPTKETPDGKRVPIRERIVRVRRDYLSKPWDLIIIDESVLLKNREAVKGHVLSTLRKQNPNCFMWALSGSPTTKYRDDLFRQLQILAPWAFTSYWRFAEFFCVVNKEGWGWTIEGDDPHHNPHHYLKDFLIVYSQDEVLPELPEYITREIPVEATPKQRKALDEMFKDWQIELEDEPDSKVVATNWLSRSTRLAQITSNLGTVPRPSGNGFLPRSSTKQDLLIDLMRQDDVEYPMIVWCWFVETAQLLDKELRKKFPKLEIGSVTGKHTSTHKDIAISLYQEGGLDILILQMGVGKFGHTFTNTKTVFYHDRSFDTDAWVQSLRRVRRIGLDYSPVLIIPKVKESADELVDSNLAGKLPSVAELTNSKLSDLLASITQ